MTPRLAAPLLVGALLAAAAAVAAKSSTTRSARPIRMASRLAKCLNSAPVVSPTASARAWVLKAAMPRVATMCRAASAISARRTTVDLRGVMAGK